MKKQTLQLYFFIIMALLVWVGLFCSFYGTITGGIKNNRVFWSITDFFSYFTIQSNLLIAFILTAASINGIKKNQKTIKPIIRGAATLYITITGLVYIILLAKISNAQGISLIGTIILHYIVPCICVLSWIFLEEKKQYQWKYIGFWLIYPLSYFAFILIRGIFAFKYPYPFINVLKLGYIQVFINAIVLTGVFSLLGAVFVLINKIAKKQA